MELNSLFSKFLCYITWFVIIYLFILFIYTLFNVDNLQLLLQKDKTAVHNILHANSFQLQ